MAVYRVPVSVQVPARGIVEIEADSLESACQKVQADIDANGFLSQAGETDFTTDWENVHALSIDVVGLADNQS